MTQNILKEQTIKKYLQNIFEAFLNDICEAKNIF